LFVESGTWVLGLFDSLLDYFIFYEKPFWDLMLFDVPALEVNMRAIFLSVCTVFGFVVSRVFLRRKKAEAALHESEEKYRTLIENAGEAILVAQDGIFIFTNPKGEELFGRSQEELALKPLTYFIHEEDREMVGDRHERRLKGEDLPPVYPFRIMDKSGHIKWVELKVVLFSWEERPATLCYMTDITGQKRAQESLKESEERYRNLVELSPEAIFVHQEWQIKYINREGTKIFGATNPQELIGKSAMELIHPDYHDAVKSRVEQVYSTRKTLPRAELKYVRIDKQVIDVEARGTYIDYLGKPATLSVIRDITKEKRKEEELRESEKRYRILMETADRSGQAIIITQDKSGTDTVSVFSNEAAVEVTGYSHEELSSLSWFEIVHPRYRDAAMKRARKRMTGEDISDLNEISIIRKDGTEIPIEICSIRSEFQGGASLITFFRDITDRRLAEEALRKSEERYRELVENAVMGFYQIEKQGKYRMVNRRMAEIFGYASPQEFMEDIDNVSELYAHPDERSKILQQIDEKGFMEGIEVEFRKKTGESIWVKLNTRATTDKDGGVIYEGTLEDITERKQMEEERKRLEDQLQQAYKMEAIGTLAGGIAHDFNNILTPIIVQSELALMDIDEKNPIRFNLQEVMKAGLRAKDLVKQILTFSRQSDQQPIPLRISPIIREAIKLLRASLPTTIEIRLNLEKDEDTVIADPTQIHQVLMNLCTNAAHAMRDKGGNLNASLSKVELDSQYTSRYTDLEPGLYMKLAVSDSGHGISPEVMDRIFDPFFTTKDRSEGTGMGLAVVHGIIKSYGGEITVESESGKGTTFNVFIPRIKTVAADEPEIVMELPVGNERVLVIDDEQGMVETLCSMLDRLGYQTTKRTSSVEALELFNAGPDRFDLVITDQTMPNITGMELAKTFMNIRPDMPIILCTGFSEKVNEDSAKAMGISAFILKPIVMRDIAHTIRQVLDPAVSKR